MASQYACWRLTIDGEDLDVEALAYARTADGFLTAMQGRWRRRLTAYTGWRYSIRGFVRENWLELERMLP